MIKCIAIDDEPLALRQLSKYMERIDDLEVVALCNSAHSADKVLAEKEVDVMFVDINMPDLSGVDFVRGLENPPMVIFTTAYSEYAIEGFKLDAVDYLLKPFSFDDFQRAVGKARSLLELQRLREEQVTSSVDTSAQGTSENNDCISIKADYKVTMVRYADIIFVESVGEYVRLHLSNASAITTLFRLKNMESTLPAERFVRVHRSFIVNLEHITGYTKGRVFLSGGEYVPIGENYKEAFAAITQRLG